MRRRQRAIVWTLVGAVPLAILAVLLNDLIQDPTWAGPMFHFYIVSLTACIATILAVLMAAAAGQVKDARVCFLALAFLSIAGIFFVHALTTPGALVPGFNPWVGFSAKLSLFAGAFFLMLSSVDARSSLHRTVVHRRGQILGLYVALLVTYGVFALGSSFAQPTRLTDDLFATLSSDTVSRVATAGTLAMMVVVIGRYAWLYRMFRTPLITGLLVSSIFLAQAQVSMEIAPLWHASWWLYHILMLSAFVVACVALAREYGLSGSLQGVVEGLLLRDTLSQMQRGYTDVIVALVGAVEARDPYTHGHTERVAELSMRIGEQIGLPQERLRTINQAALLHDIGKIGIPDSILNKPGKLTDEEFDIVKQHPERGHAIIRDARSLQQEVSGVRHHHERLDGSGYPDGLCGDEISLDARIIAVADVFDALTSVRPYRDAYSVESALSIIDRDAGTKLDSVMVAALHAIAPAWTPEAVPVSREPVYAD